jgi:predicted NodU family carbamoyl transferase
MAKVIFCNTGKEEAISCFLRTNMDVLVLENWVLTRQQ